MHFQRQRASPFWPGAVSEAIPVRGREGKALE
jgi:hypothetical protein